MALPALTEHSKPIYPPVTTHKPLFPPLTMTVADKDGMRVEWTETGQKILEEILKDISSFFPSFGPQDGLFFTQERYGR